MVRTAPPFAKRLNILRSLEKWALHTKVVEIFNLRPTNIVDFLFAESNGDPVKAVNAAERLLPLAQSLFAERLYEAYTVFDGRPTQKPFRKTGKDEQEELEKLSVLFGLSVESLCDKLEEIAREAHVPADSAATEFRSLIGEIVTWAFREAIATIKSQDTRPAA